MGVTAFSANQGTQTPILTDNNGGTAGTVIPIFKLSQDGQGTYTDANLFQGTIQKVNSIGTMPNIPGGTIGTIGNIGQIYNAGTIQNGTLSAKLLDGNGSILAASFNNSDILGTNILSLPELAFMHLYDTSGNQFFRARGGTQYGMQTDITRIQGGTVKDDGRTGRNILTFGTQIIGTAATAATIIGSASVGAGTSLWLQDVSVTNNNGNVLCVLGFGTAQQGTNVLLRHTLGTAGAVGIEKSLNKAVNAGMTNQDLVFSLGGAGTVDLTLSYFISA